jgi:hypothetical protein
MLNADGIWSYLLHTDGSESRIDDVDKDTIVLVDIAPSDSS